MKSRRPDALSARRRHPSEQPSASEAISESEMAEGSQFGIRN